MALRIRTTGAATFTATGAWGARPQYVRAWIGTNLIGEDDIGQPMALGNGDSYTISVGTIYDWTLNADGTGIDADAGMAALCNAGADEVSLRFSLHTAAHTNGGAANANEVPVATNPGYARQTAAFESWRRSVPRGALAHGISCGLLGRAGPCDRLGAVCGSIAIGL